MLTISPSNIVIRLTIFLDSRFEEAFDVAQDAFIADSMGQEGHQLVLVHVVEEAFYVGFDDVVGLTTFYRLAQRSECIMTASSRTKSVGVVYEVLLIDGLQDSDESGKPSMSKTS